MFVLTTNTIEISCLGINIIFNKIDSFYLIIWWNHIDLHFGIKDLYFGIKDYCNVMFICKLFVFNEIKYFITQL